MILTVNTELFSLSLSLSFPSFSSFSKVIRAVVSHLFLIKAVTISLEIGYDNFIQNGSFELKVLKTASLKNS